MVSVALGDETGVVSLPLDGGVPFSLVSLDEDQQIAMAIPSEVVSRIEHELIPALRNHEVFGIVTNKGHAIYGVGSGCQLSVGHIGHPNLDTLNGIARIVGGKPTQTTHRCCGKASLLKLGGEEEVLGNGIVIVGIKGEVTSCAGALAYLDTLFPINKGISTCWCCCHRTSLTVRILAATTHCAAFRRICNGVDGERIVLCRTNQTNRVPVESVADVASAETDRREEHEVGVIVNVVQRRSRPVVAVGTDVIDRSPFPAACGRQKDGPSILQGVPLCAADGVARIVCS